MQFNGKTIFLLKQMLVYVDIRPKELNVNQFSRIQVYLARYIVRILIWLWRK